MPTSEAAPHDAPRRRASRRTSRAAPGGSRSQPRGLGRRNSCARRRQRRGQDAPAARDRRSAPPRRRTHRLRRHRHHERPRLSPDGDGHRAGAGGPAPLQRADGRGESARGPLLAQARAVDRRLRARGLSDARALAEEARQDPLRRRAAGDGDRPRADDESEAALARRSLARPGPCRRRGGLPLPADPDRRRRDDPARRAGPCPCDERGDPHRLHARGENRPRGQCRRADARAGDGGVLRPAARRPQRGQRVIWANQVVQGVLLGGYYALLASGLSLMFGVMRIINLAHGDLAVLGAFLVLVMTDHGVSAFVALAAVLPAMAAVGWLLQRTLLERSLRSGVLVPLLTTFGLAIVIQNLLFEKFGANVRSLGPSIGTLAYDSWTITTQIYVAKLAVLIFGVAVALLLGLQFLLTRTPLGRSLRATAEDADTAELVGINSRAVYAFAAAIAVATVALAGAFYGMRTTFAPYDGPSQLIFAFEAVVIGGLGSLWGTLAGGIVLGVSQNVGQQIGQQFFNNSEWFLPAGHIVFLAVLAGRLLVAEVAARGGVRAVLGQAA